MSSLRPQEKKLVGRWIDLGGRLTADAVAERIDELISGSLVLVATSGDGWSKLYRDPVDQRLWELTFPESELHGGGPPALTNVAEQEVQGRYRLENLQS